MSYIHTYNIGGAAVYVKHASGTGIMIMSGGDQFAQRDSPKEMEWYDTESGTLTQMAHWSLPVHMQYPQVRLIDGHILVVITDTPDNLSRPGTWNVSRDTSPGKAYSTRSHQSLIPLYTCFLAACS